MDRDLWTRFLSVARGQKMSFFLRGIHVPLNVGGWSGSLTLPGELREIFEKHSAERYLLRDCGNASYGGRYLHVVENEATKE